MDKWEYAVMPLTTDAVKMDRLGAEGWELVAISDGFAYYKRKKITRARSKK